MEQNIKNLKKNLGKVCRDKPKKKISSSNPNCKIRLYLSFSIQVKHRSVSLVRSRHV